MEYLQRNRSTNKRQNGYALKQILRSIIDFMICAYGQGDEVHCGRMIRAGGSADCGRPTAGSRGTRKISQKRQTYPYRQASQVILVSAYSMRQKNCDPPRKRLVAAFVKASTKKLSHPSILYSNGYTRGHDDLRHTKEQVDNADQQTKESPRRCAGHPPCSD